MEEFDISSCWRTRVESAEQVSRRLRLLIEQLRPIAEPFRRWYQVIREDNIPELHDDDKWLVGAVAARINTDDLGAPIPDGGYFLSTMNALPLDIPAPDQVSLDIHAGGRFINYADMRPLRNQEMTPVLLSYRVFRQIMLAISRAFEPLWCSAGVFSLWKDMVPSRYKEGPIIAPCWMIHLSPTLAQRIAPPPDVISERFEDGSLFLAVTDETFDPDNPRHVAAAHRLFAVLDTLQEKLPPEQWRR